MGNKEKFLLLIFVVLVVSVTSFFYINNRNRQYKNFIKKSKKVSKVIENDNIAEKGNNILKKYQKSILEEKKIDRLQKAKEQQSKNLAQDSEREAKQREYELNKEFEEEAKETLPLLSIQTNNPLNTKAFGPRRGEIWVRIKPDNARELKQIMKKLADLYRSRTGYDGTITIMHWVGGRPHFKMTFSPNDENE